MINRETRDAAYEHAMAEFPLEACGLVVDGKYVPMDNVHPDPVENFAMSISAFSKIQMSKNVQVVLHSHSNGSPHPSKRDMKSAEEMDIPSGIIVMNGKTNVKEIFFYGDKTPIPAFMGRPFRHGVTDCYALVRDVYRKFTKTLLPYFPRDPKWWMTDQNILMENFDQMGFTEIPFNKMKRGDCVLMKIVSAKKVNHCGIFMGAGDLWHHLYSTPNKIRYSQCQNIHAWRESIVMCLRHKNGFPS